MEEAESRYDRDGDQCFDDAVDEFPFFDCNGKPESKESEESSTGSGLESVGNQDDELIKDRPSAETALPNGIRRRSSFRRRRRAISGGNVNDSNFDSVLSEVICAYDETISKEKGGKNYVAVKQKGELRERSDSSRFQLVSDENDGFDEKKIDNSVITSENKEAVDESATADSPSLDLDESSSSFLVLLAGLVIKAIWFQLSLLVSFFTFPIWLCYFSVIFAVNPFRTIRRIRARLKSKLLRIWDRFCETVTPYIHEQLKGQKSIGKLAFRFGWALLWSIYVCFMLVGFLVFAFIIGAFMKRYLVEEPIQMTETLNFDYTQISPIAYVPIISCSGVSCGMSCTEKADARKHKVSHVIPPNHKLQLTISLALPESEYNRRLGIFQVRADFLSINGKVTASSRYPCMLRFKSHPIRVLETFLKTAPLVAGYSSESQTLKLKMRGFTEGPDPTACLKVVLEQRAEYKPGAGIPEIYSASLLLESELPLLKRIIWCWKNTIFIWISMTMFMMELMLVLVCCRQIIMPRSRQSEGSANTSKSHQNSENTQQSESADKRNLKTRFM